MVKNFKALFCKSRYFFFSEWWISGFGTELMMTCFLNPLPSLDTVLRRSLHRGKKERETVYVSVVEAAGGRLAEFSANDPRRLANLFSRGLEFTQTARVVTPTAATERESEQEVPWHAARHVTGPRLVPVQPSVFFFSFLLRLYPHSLGGKQVTCGENIGRLIDVTLPCWFKVVSMGLTPPWLRGPISVRRRKNILLNKKYWQFGGESHYCRFVSTQNNPFKLSVDEATRIHDNIIHHWSSAKNSVYTEKISTIFLIIWMLLLTVPPRILMWWMTLMCHVDESRCSSRFRLWCCSKQTPGCRYVTDLRPGPHPSSTTHHSLRKQPWKNLSQGFNGWTHPPKNATCYKNGTETI